MKAHKHNDEMTAPLVLRSTFEDLPGLLKSFEIYQLNLKEMSFYVCSEDDFCSHSNSYI